MHKTIQIITSACFTDEQHCLPSLAPLARSFWIIGTSETSAAPAKSLWLPSFSNHTGFRDNFSCNNDSANIRYPNSRRIKPCDSQERRPIDAPNTTHKLHYTRHFRVQVSEASNTDPRLRRFKRLAEVSGWVFSPKKYHCDNGRFLMFLVEFAHAKTISCMTDVS